MKITNNQRPRTQSLPYKGSSKLSKYKMIMNDLYVDCGYPQDIITQPKPHEDHNFIQDNKKNLKNFFKDRLPYQQINKKLHNQNKILFDSLKVFEMKTQQLQLKSQTKIVLNNTFLDKNNNKNAAGLSGKKMKKVEEIFLVNDKTLELKNKFQSLNMNNRLKAYNKDNHRRQTHSYMQKRSSILKKQAYDKVFGNDSSSISRTLPVSPNKQQDNNSINKKQKRFSKTLYGKIPKQKQQNLSVLLRKMDDFKNKFKPVKLDYKQNQNNAKSSFQLSKSLDQNSFGLKIAEPQPDSNQKNKLLNLVENITGLYHQQAVVYKKPKLTCIEDLQKINSKFYHDLHQHKKSRMEKRLYELYKYSMPQMNSMIQSKLKDETPDFHTEILKANHNNREELDAFSVTDVEDQYDDRKLTQRPKKRLTINEKFRNLGTHLIKAHLQSKYYQVSPKYFYPAFWQVRQPFQMQGSYAFFKAIKMNDMQCVKSFINIKMDYLYEQDMNGKTPLIYACFHNHKEIVRYFLDLGCNVDKTCSKKKTALFYALQNKNIDTVEMLLQYGASPWSSQHCPYSKMIRQIKQLKNKQSFEILFSNAKKIFLATRLQINSSKKQQFWHENKIRIVYNNKINF